MATIYRLRLVAFSILLTFFTAGITLSFIIGHRQQYNAALLNIVFGFLLMKLQLKDNLAKWASWLALAGLLMPLGILGEVYLGLSYYLVLVGGLSIFLATVLLGVVVVQMKNETKGGQ